MEVIKKIVSAIYSLIFLINGFVFLVAGCCLDSDSLIPLMVVAMTIVIFVVWALIMVAYDKLEEMDWKIGGEFFGK